MTQLVREIALQNAPQRELSGKFVFLIPAYNEAPVLTQILKTILEAGYQNIIVVNDGSSDDTRARLEKLGDNIVVLHHYKNRGQ
jgi:glycosyltransferase involved in cell wall biosynthesis